jgi:hypothetical protein
MSVGVVLSQFEALVVRTESIGSRLTRKKIRPTRDQRHEFQELSMRLKSALVIIDTVVARLLLAGHPSDEDIRLADQVRCAKNYISITPSILMILRRNLILIFTGPKVSNLDSAQVKTRKKHTRTRCDTPCQKSSRDLP